MDLSRIMPVIRRIASEPLPQFLAIGVALFIAAQLIAGRNARPEIVVDAAQRDYQRHQFRGQFGTDPDPARLDGLLRGYIRDEVLYREAQRLGLDRDDEIIRRRLVQKMEFLLTEGAEVPTPTARELADYHVQHAAEFTQLAATSFELRYFADEGGAGGRNRALAALAGLRQGRAITGDAFAPGDRFTSLDAGEARKLFGDTALVAALTTATVGRWEGPFESGFGWHLLRVTERLPAHTAPLADVEHEVREGWQREAREKAAAERIDALIKRYRVVQVGGASPP